MADRPLSPSPNKSQHLERGVFSSISSISLYKTVIEERKQLQSNSLLQIKNPKSKSPIRNRLQPSPRIIDRSKSPEVRIVSKPDEDPSKLQETIKRLSQQLLKEKKNVEKLEENIKEINAGHKAEIGNILKNNERLQKSFNSLKSSLAAITAERDSLLETSKKTTSLIGSYQDELKTLANAFIVELTLLSNDINEEIKDRVLKQLRSTMSKAKVDLNNCISEAEKWNVQKIERIFKDDGSFKDDIAFSVEYFDHGTESLASTKGFNTNILDDIQNAVALYDFDKERDEDLEFSRGDIIEILEKNDSGWWIGRLGDKIGTFPFNFVNII
jgi:chromosome segregation ATPase